MSSLATASPDSGSQAGKLLFALLASAALGVFFWHSWVLWPFKLLVVLMHESGHAVATLLVGGHVQSISISPDEGGMTWSAYQQTLPREVIVSSAGYVGSTVSGCVLLWAAARARTGKLALYLLAGWTGLVALLYVRDLFTLAFALGATAALALCARFGATRLRRLLIAFLAAFSVLYALFDIKDDLLHFHSSGGSDADALARVTLIPAIVWGVAWGLFALVLVAFTLRGIFASEAGRSSAATLSPRSRIGA